MTINCQGKLLDLNLPKVMGILNCTDDSFYDGGRYSKEESIRQRIDQMILEEVEIIDVGGQSTRPGARQLSVEEEWENIAFALQYIHKNYPDQIVSVDSFYSEIHKRADGFGVAIINDISGGEMDRAMFETVAELQKPYILMHIRGTPQNMQQQTDYEDIIKELNFYFSKKIAELRALGINDIVIDPGFGFAKTVEQNFEILHYLHLLGFGDYPILVGLSRKSLIYKSLEISAEEALNGTTALQMYALEKGAKILRVHDVKEAKECTRLFNLINNS